MVWFRPSSNVCFKNKVILHNYISYTYHKSIYLPISHLATFFSSHRVPGSNGKCSKPHGSQNPCTTRRARTCINGMNLNFRDSVRVAHFLQPFKLELSVLGCTTKLSPDKAEHGNSPMTNLKGFCRIGCSSFGWETGTVLMAIGCSDCAPSPGMPQGFQHSSTSGRSGTTSSLQDRACTVARAKDRITLTTLHGVQ